MKSYDENPETAKVRVLVLGTSLNDDSKSWVLAKTAYEMLRAREIDAELVTLCGMNIPFAGSGNPDALPDVQHLKEAFKRATHILLALPIYNGDVSAATRNLLNIGCGFHDKTVGFLVAAGGQRAFLAVMSLGNALMYDFTCWIVPRYVYATGGDFDGQKVSNPEIAQRIERLIRDLLSRAPAPVAVNA